MMMMTINLDQTRLGLVGKAWRSNLDTWLQSSDTRACDNDDGEDGDDGDNEAVGDGDGDKGPVKLALRT